MLRRARRRPVSARAVAIAVSGLANAAMVTTWPAMIAIVMAMLANAIFKIFLVSRSSHPNLTLVFSVSMLVMLLAAISTCYLASQGVFEAIDLSFIEWK